MKVVDITSEMSVGSEEGTGSSSGVQSVALPGLAVVSVTVRHVV